LSPWNFDGSNGGFVSGLNPTTDKDDIADAIANWGEDKNFNGVQDGVCNSNPAAPCFVPDGLDNGCASCAGLTPCPDASDRLCNAEEDPNTTGTFEQNWNTRGGCGWQTQPPHVCTIDTDRGCFADADCLGICQSNFFPADSSFDPCTDANDCPNVGPGAGLAQVCNNYGGTCNLGSTATAGGVWHTGEIGDFGDPCSADTPCARFTPVSGIQIAGAPRLRWWETLLTPVMEKVNQSLDGNGDNNATIEITGWQWNQAVDLVDDNVAYAWEFDTDIDKLLPVDNVADGTVFNSGFGSFGAISGGSNPDLTDGYSMFATVSTCSVSGTPCLKDADCENLTPSGQTCVYTASGVTTNGSVGNNREGQNGCYFEGPGAILPDNTDRLGFAKPLDDDQDNDGDLIFDEYVTANGPIRNAGINDFNGLDLRAGTFEDLYGETGERFQGSISFINFQAVTDDTDPAAQSFGLAVDDMEVEWEEFTLVNDATDCATGGSCATVEVTTGNVFTSSSIIGITVLDQFPYGEDGVNDCDGDGLYSPNVCVGGTNDGQPCDENGVLATECPGGGSACDATQAVDDTDCDNNGTDDVVVDVASAAEGINETPEILVGGELQPAPFERLVCNSTGTANEYFCEISTSTTVDTVGVLFISQNAGAEPVVSVRYQDLWDGRGFRVCALPTDETNNAGFVCTSDGQCTNSTCELSVCQNDVDPTQWGVVETATTVFVPACVVSVSGVS
ncbi:MAG: hypothetical protein GY708_22810, partial [Actinomycetia bacterium]|nr:hypothetical protein [Actinomycetes bacterium]